MLSFLQIRNFTIVEALDLEFRPGFTAITGETGAGKSILVDALGLLIGNRADTGAIRSGASKAELSAEFDLEEGSGALAWLREADLDHGNSCLLRRLISDSGRSRAWINGTAVTLQQLAELGDLLVEIHGQNEHIRLVRRDEQFRLLDAGGSHDENLTAVLGSYQAWAGLEAEKQSLMEETPLDAGDIELLEYQRDELEGSLLAADEFQQLEADHRRLAKGSEIVSALEFALDHLESEQHGVSGKLHQAVGQLQEHADLDTEIQDAVGLLGEAAINCEEARSSLNSALSRMDLSPERLAQVEARLRSQYDLARKHRVEPEQLADVLESLQNRLERAAMLDTRLQEIELSLETALQDYRQAALELHEARCTRAKTLSLAVTDLMQKLGMEGGCFDIAIQHEADGPPSARGSDRLELKVSANPGIPPGPLRKVASGGELSRISLAIKVAAKASTPAQTQIFDEVDAGIGGDTANAVGALLKSLSTGEQALCVTHLAQVAVCADQQFQVQKTADAGLTSVQTTLLGEKERINEIARMLGGRLSDQSRAHATELLATAAVRH
jgi:DNA repair protein RecN (Recombination protein N)